MIATNFYRSRELAIKDLKSKGHTEAEANALIADRTVKIGLPPNYGIVKYGELNGNYVLMG